MNRFDVEVRVVVRISRILRDYNDAGGVNTLLAPWGFLRDGVAADQGRTRWRWRTGSVELTSTASLMPHATPWPDGWRRPFVCSTNDAACISTWSSGRRTPSWLLDARSRSPRRRRVDEPRI